MGQEIKKLAKTTLFISILFFFFLLGIKNGECQGMGMQEGILSSLKGKIPKEWGERVKGVKTRLKTDQKVIALTFDACRGTRSSGYDEKLIRFLSEEKIPATLFMSGKWIDVNQGIFLNLAKRALFEIENHGLNYKPCSVNGRSAYGIEGTKSVEEIFDEIEGNALKIQSLTGRKPRYYRPAAATCDEICVEIANGLGYEVVNFSALGDAGATYTKKQVKEALLKAPPSSIILMHMNRPDGETADGLMEAIPEIKKHGFRFVKLSAYSLR